MREHDVQLESSDFRRTMSHFCTGVAIVASLFDGEPVGMTCQSFVSVSIDPPLALFCPSHASTTWPAIRDSGLFCVSVLTSEQKSISEVFAISGTDKFKDIEWSSSSNGSPQIAGSLAHIDCALDTVHPAGDHDIALARVTGLQVADDGLPLLFFQQRFANISVL